jgi:hypothetical protein
MALLTHTLLCCLVKQEEARRQAEIMRQARLEQVKLVQLAQWRKECPSVLDQWPVRY